MKKVEKKYNIKYVYVADDGREFKNLTDCEIYEALKPLTLYDILKDYCYFDNETKKYLEKNQCKCSSYIIVHTLIPEEKYLYCKMIECDEFGYNIENDYASLSGIPNLSKYDSAPVLFYNDWHNAFNGNSGPNGWLKIGSKESFQQRIESFQNKIKIFEELE